MARPSIEFCRLKVLLSLMQHGAALITYWHRLFWGEMPPVATIDNSFAIAESNLGKWLEVLIFPYVFRTSVRMAG